MNLYSAPLPKKLTKNINTWINNDYRKSQFFVLLKLAVKKNICKEQVKIHQIET